MSFGPHLRMGAGCQNNQLCDQRTETVSLTLLASREGEGLEAKAFTRGSCVHQSPLCNDPSMKTNRTGLKEMTQVGERVEVRRECWVQRGHEHSTYLCPMHLFCLAVPELYPCIINC